MIHVIIADDHELIRDGMRRLMEHESDIAIVGEAANAAEVMELLRNTQADVLVLDISLPDRDGIEVLKDIRAEGISICILVLSMHPETRYAKRALKNGASGYLTKDSASEEIGDAIHTVYRTGSYITGEVAEQLYRDMNVYYGEDEENRPMHESLSDREYQTFLLLGNGKSVREVSESLGLSVNTVNSYRRRVLEKMQLHSNAEIIRYTAFHGLLQ